MGARQAAGDDLRVAVLAGYVRQHGACLGPERHHPPASLRVGPPAKPAPAKAGVDGYAGYNRLTGRGCRGGTPLRLAYCWAHCRRRLREIYDSSGSEIAAEGLRRIAELYAIEAEIRASTPERRLAERQARSALLVLAFGGWLKQQRARVSPKSRLGEKLAYIARHWDGLQLFLADGRVETQ